MYKINDRVREEFRNDPKYLLALDNLMKMLEMEKDLDVYCAHEAGHITYFLKMGATESEFVYKGPTIYFNFEMNNFDIFPCAVAKPKTELRDNQDLELLAKASAAGGVFEKELEGSTTLGDKNDRFKFHTAYAVALNLGFIPRQTEQQMWELAQNDVKSDLINESNIAAARKLTKEIKKKCFQIAPI
jgi:hypothetical protein